MESIVAMKKVNLDKIIDFMSDLKDNESFMLLYHDTDNERLGFTFDNMDNGIALCMLDTLLSIIRSNVEKDRSDIFSLIDVMQFTSSEIVNKYGNQQLLLVDKSLAPDGSQFN